MSLTSYTFDQLINFTRTTSGTYTNSSGLIANTPASVNLLTYTQEFDNAAWVKTAGGVAVNTTAAPDGTTTADTVLSTAAASGAARLTQSPAITGGTSYTISSYFKANGTDYAFLSLRTSGANWAGAEFNLATGVFNRSAVSGNVAYVGSNVTAVGNGWYRCSVTVTPTDSVAAGSGFIFFGPSNGSAAFVGGYLSGN